MKTSAFIDRSDASALAHIRRFMLGAAARQAGVVFLAAALAFVAGPSFADAVGGEPVVIPAQAPQAVSAAPGEEAQWPSDGDWEFEVAPYVWFVFIPGQITIFDTTIPVDIEFDDVWKHLNFAFFMDAEIRKGKVGLFTDIMYAKLWGRTQGSVFQYKTDTKMVLLDFALFAEVAEFDLGTGSSPAKLRLQPYVGGRFVHNGVEVRVDPIGRDLDSSTNNAAPILGLRGFVDIDEHWNVSFQGDGGGFGVSNLDRLWLAELLGGYRWNFGERDLNLMIGYKGVGVEQSNGPVTADLTFHGPVLKLALEF